MPNLLVRDVPEHVVETLKLRAANHRRSLQMEMLEILEQASEQPTTSTAAEAATAIRKRLAEKGVHFEDSAPLIRADRER
jgi:antitoxin FitA